MYGFFFVEVGDVSTANVTERISFVNFFAAVFLGGAFWNLLGFSHCWSNFDARCQKFVGFVIAGFFEQSLVCHFLENGTPALFSTLKVILIFSHQR